MLVRGPRRPYARLMSRSFLVVPLLLAAWSAAAGGTAAAAPVSGVVIQPPCHMPVVPASIEQVDIASLDGPFVVPTSLRAPPRVEFIAPPVDGATVTDDLGLFASGPLGADQVYDRNYRWAGRYGVTVDTTSSIVHGSVDVKMRPSRTRVALGHRIALQWATARPRGYVFDVQRRAPGSRRWRSLRGGTTELFGCVTPTRAGSYHYRARMRKRSSGAHSGYSPAIRVRITS
jgi:hypothetical protein